MGLSLVGHDVYLAQVTGVHSIDNYVVFIKSCGAGDIHSGFNCCWDSQQSLQVQQLGTRVDKDGSWSQ